MATTIKPEALAPPAKFQLTVAQLRRLDALAEPLALNRNAALRMVLQRGLAEAEATN